MELTDEQLEILAYTVLGEAAGEGYTGMAAVAHVIRNRAESGRYPSDPAATAKQPSQFSTWNKGAGGNNPTARYSKDGATYKRAEKAVKAAFSGKEPDPTGGATHYWAPRGMPGKKDPYWASTEETKFGRVKIGNHIFLARAPTKVAAAGANVSSQKAEQSMMRNRVIPDAPARRPDTVNGKPVKPLPTPEPLSFAKPAGGGSTVLTSRSVKTKDYVVNPATGMVTLASAAAKPPAPVAAKTAAKPAVKAQGKTAAQIAQEADNARLNGYRAIQEMGPSSKGAKPNAVATPVVVKKPGAVKTTAPEQQPIPKGVVPQVIVGGSLTPKPTSANANLNNARSEQAAQRGGSALTAAPVTNPLTGPGGMTGTAPVAPADAAKAARLAAGAVAAQKASAAQMVAQRSAQAAAARAAEAKARSAALAVARGQQARQQAAAAVAARTAAMAAVSRPAITGVGGGGAYTTTEFQQDRFQTTSGSLMPSSMNNSRWTTGY
jgi:hypothetical protein